MEIVWILLFIAVPFLVLAALYTIVFKSIAIVGSALFELGASILSPVFNKTMELLFPKLLSDARQLNTRVGRNNEGVALEVAKDLLGYLWGIVGIVGLLLLIIYSVALQAILLVLLLLVLFWIVLKWANERIEPLFIIFSKWRDGPSEPSPVMHKIHDDHASQFQSPYGALAEASLSIYIDCYIEVLDQDKLFGSPYGYQLYTRDTNEALFRLLNEMLDRNLLMPKEVTFLQTLALSMEEISTGLKQKNVRFFTFSELEDLCQRSYLFRRLRYYQRIQESFIYGLQSVTTKCQNDPDQRFKQRQLVSQHLKPLPKNRFSQLLDDYYLWSQAKDFRLGENLIGIFLLLMGLFFVYVCLSTCSMDELKWPLFVFGTVFVVSRVCNWVVKMCED